MAPGPIPRNYATQELFDRLEKRVDRMEKRVDRMTDSMVVLADVMKLFTSKLYGHAPDESAEEIFKRTEKMIKSWE